MSGFSLCLLLQACGDGLSDSESMQDYFPLQPGMVWHYQITTTIAERDQHSEFIIRADEIERIGETNYATRISDQGTRYYLRQTEAGVYRAAKRTIVELQPRLDASKRWVLKKPYVIGTNWNSETHPYVLHRVYPYKETLGKGVKVKMNYQIAALNERVQTVLGSFDNCLRVEGTAQLNVYVDARTGYQDIDITTTEWYAPGIGLIKLVREEPLITEVFVGGRVTYELSDFER